MGPAAAAPLFMFPPEKMNIHLLQPTFPDSGLERRESDFVFRERKSY